MEYILSNVFSFITLLFILGLAFLMQRKKQARIFTTFNLAISALFCALSVILTNVIGYSFIFGVQMMLGNFLIFLIGMIFGPLIGTVSAIVTDSVGSLINMGGAYHFGFMLIKVILGFAGGIVFFFKTNKLWKTKMFSCFTIAYLLTAILSPVFLYTLYGTNYTMVKFLIRLMRLPIDLFVYNSLIYLTFKVSYLFLSVQHQGYQKLWLAKNGSLKMPYKKSLRQKYKLDLDGNDLKTRKQTNKYYQQIHYNNIDGVITYEK